MNNRVSSYAQQVLHSRNIKVLQEEAATKTLQAARGGKISDSFADIASNVERVINNEVVMTQLDTFNKNLDIVYGRLSTMEKALSQMAERVSMLLGEVVFALGATLSGTQTTIDLAPAALDDIAMIGNVKLGGKFLFGKGSNVPPIDISQLPTPVSGDEVDYSYASVGNLPFSIKVSSNQPFEYGVGADTPAFERTIRGLVLLKTSDARDRERLSQALGCIQSGLEGISQLQATIGYQMQNVEHIKSFHTRSIEDHIRAESQATSQDLPQVIQEYGDAQLQTEIAFQVLRQLQQSQRSLFGK